MKKLKLVGKFIFFINVVFALLLLLSFILPYVAPKTFPNISLLSLAVSPLLLINFIFAGYWLLRKKKRIWLSSLLLVIAYFHFSPFIEIGSSGDPTNFENTLKVLSYNVRLFNAYEEEQTNTETTVFQQIMEAQNPDIVCTQEHYKKASIDMTSYPHQYVYFRDAKSKMGHAIYSKYPILKGDALNFEDSYNNALYVDILKNNDTLRVYNIHLQSLGISSSVSSIHEGDKTRLRRRLSKTFSKQQDQVEVLLAHSKNVMHPIIIAGDFNNTPFSYTYHKLQEDRKDAFIERGSGLGTTYKFDGYPMRIDYLLSPNSMEVIDFKTLSETFSDHYPIVATFGWDKK